MRFASARAIRYAKTRHNFRLRVTSKNGWITVYDAASDAQDDALIRRIAEGLSRAAKTDVFGFIVHDSDLAGYWLYQCGKLVD
jgi:hypothetical protein